MSGREKVGLQSKSSNSKKDEKNLEEKKERDTNNKTRTQLKVNRNLIRVRKIVQNTPMVDGDKNQTKNKTKPVVSRRKNSVSIDQTLAIRKTRQTKDLLELNSELIKQSPTVIDRLISKNKSAIKKNQLKQGKGMPEKSVKEDTGEDTDNKAADQLESDSQVGKRLKGDKPTSYIVKRKKIDAGKLLATTLARKKLKASQACIEMSAKKRLLRSNVITKGDKNSLFNLDQKRKLNKGVKILRRKAAVSSEDTAKKRVLKKATLVGEVSKVVKGGDVKNVAGPSNSESSDENISLSRVQLKSRGGKILQTINPLVRPLKKFPVNSVGLGVNRWKVGLQSSGRGRGRGRGRGGRILRGRGGRGFLHKRTPYLTRSDSPVPLLRNGKRRNCDPTDDTIECVKRRRRNISNEFSKSESLPDDQVSCANDSEFSFSDSVSTIVKGENFDIDDVKIKTEISSPNHKEVSSDKMDSNCNLFDSNQDEKLNAKNFNSVKLTVNSPSEIKTESVDSNINVETKGCDYKDSKIKISDTSIGTTNSSVPLDSKTKIKSCRSLSLESKSDCNLEDSSDCDISGDKNVSSAQKLRKKSDISERKKISRSLWVRRSLRGVQKNPDSDDLSEILKLTESEEVKHDSETPGALCSLQSDDNKKSSDERRLSNDFDPDLDFCLQIEDSPLKTDNKEIKLDDSSCKTCIDKEEVNIEQKVLDLVDNKEINVLPGKSEVISESNDFGSSCKSCDSSDQLQKELIKENDDEKEMRLIYDKSPPPSLLLSDVPNTVSESVVNSDTIKPSNFSVNDCKVFPSESTTNSNNNENGNDANAVLILDDNKIVASEDDITILDFGDELMKIGDDDIGDKDLESIDNFSDKNNDIEITFFKTKDLVEKEKINEIIESLEACDELDEEVEKTDIVCCNSETEINKSPCSSSIAKDNSRDNVIEITENESSDVIPVNDPQLSSTAEDNVCKTNDNSTLASVLLDDSNSKDNITEDKEFNSIEKSNDDVNLNFSDQSSTSSSYTSAVTELPTSVDSDALEMGDNLSNNDWSEKHFDIGENITDNSSQNDNMNNIDNKIIELEANKVFGSVNLDSSSVVTINDSENKSIADKFYESEQINSDSTFVMNNPDSDVIVTDESAVKEESFNSLMNDEIKITETPEERANKESILSALGLQSLHTSCNEKSKKPDSNYTGTLKAVIKLNRGAGDKKSGGRKMFFKQYDLNTEKDVGAGGDTLEYKIYSEHEESSENGQADFGSHRKTQMKQRTVSLDETSNCSISAFTSTPVDSLASSEGAKDDKGAVVKQSNLVIPEKSSSFSIHPGRLCSDICSYCFGKFGSLDTPCHLAQLKNAERQQKILANESHLKMDSCLCDGCYRYVDRKANCPQALQRSKKRRTLHNAVCSVQNCMQPAQHSIRRKWLVKLKKSISKKLDIDMDKNPHLPFPLCNQHYYWVDYFTVCGICKKRLTRNHMYALGAEANELNMALKKDGIPVRLSDKLFLCKLCRYYSSLRIKYKDTSVLNANHKLFLRSYKKKILAYLDIPVSESEGEAEKSSHEDESNSVEDLMKSKKRKSKQVVHEVKKRKILDGKPESCDSVDEPQMIDYSYLDTLKINMGSNKKTGESSSESQSDSLGFSSIASLLNPLEGRQNNTGYTKDTEPKVKVDVKPTRIQVKFGNLNIGKLSNLNIGQDSRTGREKPRTSTNWLPHLPGEKELPLVGELKQEDNLGRNGWEKYTLSLQFDRETKRLWNELQRPYGNQSSFLRHLVMLEKYWRSGSLVLAENADPRAVKYNQRARTRVQAYESVSARPASTFVVSSMTPVITTTTTVASSVTVTSSLPATPLMTAISLPSSSASYSSSKSLPSSPLVSRLPEVVQIVKPMTSISSTASSKSDTSPAVQISPSPASTITPPPPPPLLKLDSSGVMWQKVQTNNQSAPMFTFQNSQFVRPIKVVVSSMSSSSGGKPVPNVISVLSSANSKTSPSSRPIKMTLQQFQSFQKRVKKDIKITPALNISPIESKVSASQYSSASCSTTITASAALAAARAVTTVTTAISMSPSTHTSSSSNVDTFIPLICDVRSLAGTNSSWSRSIKPAKGSKVTYYTPILPKLPNTVTVRQIVPPNTSVPLNSSVTIEKAPSDDSLSITSLVPEKPSISVFREDCSDSSV